MSTGKHWHWSNESKVNQSKIQTGIKRNISPEESLKRAERLKKYRFVPNSRNGQTGLYRKLRKEVQEGKHPCEECGSLKSEIHHKEKLHYDKKWRNWKVDNFVNLPDKIKFLCNSCHQKLHYRELGRVSKVEHDPETGKFLKGNEVRQEC